MIGDYSNSMAGTCQRISDRSRPEFSRRPNAAESSRIAAEVLSFEQVFRNTMKVNSMLGMSFNHPEQGARA